MKQLNKAKCIFERVYIETPVDTDGDGKLDLILAHIRRPETTLSGEKVPAVLVANPYLMTCNEDWYEPHNVNRDVKIYPTQNIKESDIRFDFGKPISYDNVVPRETKGFADSAVAEDDFEFEAVSDLYGHLNNLGYASVFSGGLGTLGSEGFTLSGSREEVLAFKAIIDWLNGRARAFTNKTDNIEVKADWCTGNVAMSAKSYLGTMCIGVAATGVDGLKAIIPEAGICNWYDYYRQGGLNRPALDWQGDDLDILAKYCFSRAKDPADYETVKDAYDKALAKLVEGEDRDSGNYNLFWDERNYLREAHKIKAATFIIHGINDWNVKTDQCYALFNALEENGVDRRLLLHQGEHVYIYDLKDSGALGMIEKWLAHYLKGEDNGVDTEPKVYVESNVDQLSWMTSDNWPPAEMSCVDFPKTIGDDESYTIIDNLSSTIYDKDKDNQSEWLDELVMAEGVQHCLRMDWDPFEKSDKDIVRISGSVGVSFDAKIDQPTAILSCMLVDVGKTCRITNEEETVDEDGTFVFKMEETPSEYKVISRGWLNAQNRTCLWSKEEITPGKTYSYHIDMVPTDHSVIRGHKLRLIVYGIDAQQTQRPDTITNITLSNIHTKVPMV